MKLPQKSLIFCIALSALTGSTLSAKPNWFKKIGGIFRKTRVEEIDDGIVLPEAAFLEDISFYAEGLYENALRDLEQKLKFPADFKRGTNAGWSLDQRDQLQELQQFYGFVYSEYVKPMLRSLRESEERLIESILSDEALQEKMEELAFNVPVYELERVRGRVMDSIYRRVQMDIANQMEVMIRSFFEKGKELDDALPALRSKAKRAVSFARDLGYVPGMSAKEIVSYKEAKLYLSYWNAYSNGILLYWMKLSLPYSRGADVSLLEGLILYKNERYLQYRLNTGRIGKEEYQFELNRAKKHHDAMVRKGKRAANSIDGIKTSVGTRKASRTLRFVESKVYGPNLVE